MYRFRATKAVIFMILLMMIVLFLFSLTCVKRKNPMLPYQSSISGSSKLKQVLRAASMSTRTVILTIMDKTWATNGSIVDLFVESFKKGENTRHLLNHLVIAVLDLQSLHYCQTIHPHCFYLHLQTTPTPILYDSINYPTLRHLRNQLLLEVLHFGYNLVYTEADVMWLRNPFPLFHPGSEVTLGCDSTWSNGNAGFFYIRANLISIDFLLLWNLINVLYPATRNKSVCEIALYQDFKRIGVHIHFIDSQYYGGFCDITKDISNIYTMHANCCHDMDHKIHDLTIFLHYSNYKPLLGNGITLELLSAAAGKTPMKCFSTRI